MKQFRYVINNIKGGWLKSNVFTIEQLNIVAKTLNANNINYYIEYREV